MNDEIKIEKDSGRDMTPRLIGETYLRKPTEKSQQRYSFGLYECQYCGEEFEGRVYSVKRGNTKSCGCQKNKQKITHGLANSRFYKTWKHMVGRCSNPNNKKYKDYGARGITVCEEWLNVSNFVAWCEETYPNLEGMTLDRIDVDGNYEPNNCRWADKTTQAINQRIMKNNTSGFVGVCWYKSKDKWVAIIHFNNVRFNIGSFHTKEEAVQARDTYIIENNLPHKLSTDYK